MTGKISSLHISPESNAPCQAMDVLELHVGKGIHGDHHYRDNGSVPETELTLIAAEEIEAFNLRTGLHLQAADLRRNVLTQGLDLNALVGRRFRIGDAEAEGLELCEPCRPLGQRLATESVSASTIVRELTKRGGLRARILHDGLVRPGDAIIPVS